MRSPIRHRPRQSAPQPRQSAQHLAAEILRLWDATIVEPVPLRPTFLARVESLIERDRFAERRALADHLEAIMEPGEPRPTQSRRDGR